MGLWLESQILRWQHTGTQQLDWEQQTGTQQLDWEQQGLQQLDWEQPLEPHPPLPQLEQEQAGTQQQTGTQQLEPQPPEQPEQLMVLVVEGGAGQRSRWRERRCSGVESPGPGASIYLQGQV